MLLSTKSRYGLKAAYELALHASEAPLPLNDIAEKQRISESYLEQIFSALRKAGIVKAIRGASGGYMLTAEPCEITVGQVIRALDGSMSPVQCVDEDGACDNAECCVTRHVWEKLRIAIDTTIDGITLQDMIDENKGSTVHADEAYDGSCR